MAFRLMVLISATLVATASFAADITWESFVTSYLVPNGVSVENANQILNGMNTVVGKRGSHDVMSFDDYPKGFSSGSGSFNGFYMEPVYQKKDCLVEFGQRNVKNGKITCDIYAEQITFGSLPNSSYTLRTRAYTLNKLGELGISIEMFNAFTVQLFNAMRSTEDYVQVGSGINHFGKFRMSPLTGNWSFIGAKKVYRSDEFNNEDYDGDGVLNDVDACVATGVQGKVILTGANIGCPDNDLDTFMDSVDVCPNETWTVPVMTTGQYIGCQDLDADIVPDYLDQCPGSTPGQRIGTNGCVIVVDCSPKAITFPFYDENQVFYDECRSATYPQYAAVKYSFTISSTTDGEFQFMSSKTDKSNLEIITVAVPTGMSGDTALKSSMVDWSIDPIYRPAYLVAGNYTIEVYDKLWVAGRMTPKKFTASLSSYIYYTANVCDYSSTVDLTNILSGGKPFVLIAAVKSSCDSEDYGEFVKRINIRYPSTITPFTIYVAPIPNVATYWNTNFRLELRRVAINGYDFLSNDNYGASVWPRLDITQSVIDSSIANGNMTPGGTNSITVIMNRDVKLYSFALYIQRYPPEEP